MKQALLMMAAALSLAACGSNPQEATEANLKKAVEQSAVPPLCLPLALDITAPDGRPVSAGNALGGTVIKIAERSFNGEKINREAQKQLDILTDQRFYRREKDEYTGNDGKTAVRVYTLTEKGAAQTRPSPHGPLFCLGNQKVNKINWFTTPSPANGVVMTKVSYTAALDAESWADKLIRAGGESWQTLTEEKNRLATLIQTNRGWRDWQSLRDTAE
ncbi:hypothetical protein [Neisseria leonii]|uniref:hypothetical protein n=1 Tax=Neisseria leonii TaxID=2995413 RepID=UPI00237A5433|nr:hypothetical protein [Neisseria sp. 3986]MDD9325088.1 hypothetical protein [Neisseria sp. 3986]